MTNHTTATRRALACATALTAAAALAACTRHLDMPKSEEAIKTGIAQKLLLPLASVKCPERREKKAGDVFDCKAIAASGGELLVRVTQTSAKGDLSWELPRGQMILVSAAVEKYVEKGLAARSIDATVDCGGKSRLPVAGKTFECTAKTTSGAQQIVVTMNDDKGDVSWALK